MPEHEAKTEGNGETESYERIGFTHNLMFREVLRDDEELARALLERVLGFPIEHIEEKDVEHAMDPRLNSKGVRFDVYVKTTGKVIDVEMQATRPPALGLRMRYYQGALDLSILPKGGKHKHLPESYIVFLCREDPFGRGIPRYTVRPVCEEDPSVDVAAHMRWLLFNASAFEKEEDPNLRSLLCYIEDGTVDETDELVCAIDAKVDALNETDEVKKMVWTWQDEIDFQADLAFEKGEAEGLAEGEARLSALINKLLGSDRIQDIERVTTDAAYRETLFKEFGIA